MAPKPRCETCRHRAGRRSSPIRTGFKQMKLRTLLLGTTSLCLLGFMPLSATAQDAALTAAYEAYVTASSGNDADATAAAEAAFQAECQRVGAPDPRGVHRARDRRAAAPAEQPAAPAEEPRLPPRSLLPCRGTCACREQPARANPQPSSLHRSTCPEATCSGAAGPCSRGTGTGARTACSGAARRAARA